ncbi:MAG: hypothetical protein KA270_02790 [Saprospiraceae bacterium]|nr:hypothetical protein [Saprospiraceae bacterium]
MTNYKIIEDEQLLIYFIDTVLPDLKQDECFYLSLFARKKYCPEMIWSNDKTQLKRLTCNKKNIISKLRQLEIPIGNYSLGDRDVPQESLVAYIHPNPRSQTKAAKLLLKKLADLISDDSHGYNVQQEALSSIQKSIGSKYYIDFDFDLKDKGSIEKIRRQVYELVNKDATIFVETRGGIHVLVQVSKIEEKYKKTWYQSLSNLGADVSGDCMLPIPGCVQGGFISKLI